MSQFSDRPITLQHIPASEQCKILRVEQVALKCGSVAVDLGALCYLKRANERRARGKGRRVVIDSYDGARANSIRRIADRLLMQSAARELAPPTILARCSALIRFLDWCDENDHRRALESVELGRGALKGFISHLRQLFDVHRIQLRSVYTWQANLIQVLNQHFDIANIGLGVNVIVWDGRLAPSTEAPPKIQFNKFVTIMQAVFAGFADLVLEGRTFPHAVRMPPFVGYPDNKMWVFPTMSAWVKHPSTEFQVQRNQSYDYENGRMKPLEEVAHLYKNRYSAEACLEKSLGLVRKANLDMREASRVKFAAIANSVFCTLFETITGVNRAVCESIEWTLELEEQINNPGSERQGFRSLKARANRREVYFQVGIVFLPLLRKFAQLRSWLLNGERYDFMFFHYTAIGPPSSIGPRNYTRSDIGNLSLTMRLIFPQYEQIRLGSRKTRAARQDDVIRNFDPSVGAMLMLTCYPKLVRC